MNVREAIHSQPMKGMQIWTVAICLVLTMIDGFDILVMAFVAPNIAKVWRLGQIEIGYLLSAGVFGMALGSVFVSPLADRIGRRPHAIACLICITLGMALSATAASVAELVVYRAIAGVFIGGIVATLNVTAAEYSSDKRRGTVMGIYGIGFPAGAAIGGAVTGMLLATYDWRAAFIFGAAATGLMAVIVVFWLPESIEYLIEKRPGNGLDQYNRIADKLGYSRATALPAAILKAEKRVTHKAVFGGVMGVRTAFLWIAYAALMAAFYFANTWTTKLLSDASGNPQLGVKAGVLVLAGGVAGALLFAALSAAFRPRQMTTLLMFGGAVAFALYANNFGDVSLALVLAFVVGIFANGGIAAYYAISPTIYPAAVRATGVGWMIGFGRTVAIVTPIGAGYLLSRGWKAQEVYQLFAAVLVISGIFCVLLDRTYRGRSENPETPELMAEEASAMR